MSHGFVHEASNGCVVCSCIPVSHRCSKCGKFVFCSEECADKGKELHKEQCRHYRRGARERIQSTFVGAFIPLMRTLFKRYCRGQSCYTVVAIAFATLLGFLSLAMHLAQRWQKQASTLAKSSHTVVSILNATLHQATLRPEGHNGVGDIFQTKHAKQNSSDAGLFGVPSMGTRPIGRQREIINISFPNFTGRSSNSISTHLPDTQGRSVHKPLQPSRKNCSDKKLVFIHVNKAGGTSVVQALRECEAIVGKTLFTWDSNALMHTTVRQHIQKLAQKGIPRRVAANMWHRDFFSFSVVRDPYERQLSLFRYNVQKCLKDDTDLNANWPFKKSEIKDANTLPKLFGLWLRHLDKRYPIGSLDNALFSGMGSANSRKDASQTAWLSDYSNELAVTKILKLTENLSQSLRAIVSSCFPACAQVELKHLKISGGIPNMSYYKGDPEAVDIINRQMARDFELLGFAKLAERRESP